MVLMKVSTEGKTGVATEQYRINKVPTEGNRSYQAGVLTEGNNRRQPKSKQ